MPTHLAEPTPRMILPFVLLLACIALGPLVNGAAWGRHYQKVALGLGAVVLFIFIISNAGGCLTPIGDPPLFLGYLKGVPFWWVAQHAWPMWLTGVGMLLTMFLIVDRLNYRR